MSKIPTAFNPLYQKIVETLVKRKLIVSLRNGEIISLDLNKGNSFFDIPIETRTNISALRLIVGREQVTLSSKVNNQHVEGFFFHLMERNRGVIGNIAGLHTPLLKERIGFCYQANGKSIEFAFKYEDIIKQINKREQMIESYQDQIEESFDPIEIEKLEDKLKMINQSHLSFNIFREQKETNLFEMGLNIPEFYLMNEEEKIDSGYDFQDFRYNYLEHMKKNDRRPHNIEFPRLPRLPDIGKPAKVIFQTRESRSIDINI